MIDAMERKTGAFRDPAGRHYTRQQRRRKTRSRGHSHGVEFLQAHPRLRERRFDRMVRALRMRARGNLRDYAAIRLMQPVLSIANLGTNVSRWNCAERPKRALHNCGRRVITA